MENQSRRDFFKLSAVGTGAIALGATGMGSTLNAADKSDIDLANAQAFVTDQGIYPSRNPAYPNTLPKVDPSQVKETIEADIIVVGAGLSGMCAAVSAAEVGSKVIVLEKYKKPGARGGHITAFGSNFQDKNGLTKDIPARQIVRELVRWGQGRMNENILRLFVEKSGSCMDWLEATVAPKGIYNGQWKQSYKGPDYYEYPVTHMFTDKTGETGNVPLVDALVEIAKEKGVEVIFEARVLKLVKNGNKATAVIAKTKKGYIQYAAKKGIILATGDYAANKDMVSYYSQTAALADAQLYFPSKSNTGDGHMLALDIGAAMQKDVNHAAVVHLEAGANSYNFLHVNAFGKRFKNEDVNTQSKSCGKLYQKDGVAWSVYDAKGLDQVKSMMDKQLAGGLFFGQTYTNNPNFSIEDEKKFLEKHIAEGKVVVANTMEELAQKMNVPVAEFVKTVKRYNEIVKAKNDTDYGKRSELLFPLEKAPFYAGKLLATVLTMCGGLHADERLLALDKDDNAIEQLYVVGALQGDFFAGDYPTICPGIGHGRCMTMGRLAGLKASGKSFDDVKTKMTL